MGVPQDRRGVGRGVINIAFEYHRVRICDGVCDSADLCGRSDCECYDIPEETTRPSSRPRRRCIRWKANSQPFTSRQSDGVLRFTSTLRREREPAQKLGLLRLPLAPPLTLSESVRCGACCRMTHFLTSST
jgi:hypothetical protein